MLVAQFTTTFIFCFEKAVKMPTFKYFLTTFGVKVFQSVYFSDCMATLPLQPLLAQEK